MSHTQRVDVTSFSFEWKGKAVGVNKRLMRSKHGKFMLTPEYRAFKESLGYAINALSKPTPPLCGILRVDMRQTTRHDCDALLKPVIDVMEDCGVILDDKDVQAISVMRVPKGKTKGPDKIRVFVEEIDELGW